eukprot:359433-Chlamydomonas_euryale.AAC.6
MAGHRTGRPPRGAQACGGQRLCGVGVAQGTTSGSLAQTRAPQAVHWHRLGHPQAVHWHRLGHPQAVHWHRPGHPQAVHWHRPGHSQAAFRSAKGAHKRFFGTAQGSPKKVEKGTAITVTATHRTGKGCPCPLPKQQSRGNCRAAERPQVSSSSARPMASVATDGQISRCTGQLTRRRRVVWMKQSATLLSRVSVCTCACPSRGRPPAKPRAGSHQQHIKKACRSRTCASTSADGGGGAPGGSGGSACSSLTSGCTVRTLCLWPARSRSTCGGEVWKKMCCGRACCARGRRGLPAAERCGKRCSVHAAGEAY